MPMPMPPGGITGAPGPAMPGMPRGAAPGGRGTPLLLPGGIGIGGRDCCCGGAMPGGGMGGRGMGLPGAPGMGGRGGCGGWCCGGGMPIPPCVNWVMVVDMDTCVVKPQQ